MAAVPVSKAEIDFTLQALREEGIRVDGRALTAWRRLGVRFGAAHGEVEVTFGPTRASAVCSGEIVTPPVERPNEGRISFHVEFGQIASPSFESGRPSVQATTVANLIERLIKGSRAVDAEALCIVGGQKVWSIRVDVRALDDDGNLGDVCAIAALCSLLHFRKTDVEVRGETLQVFSSDERVPVPLSIHHLPVPVNFALFAPCTGKRHSDEPVWILDPNRLEEAAMDGSLCIAVNQHGELCGLHKPGGLPIDFALIEQCTPIAVARAAEITSRVKAELAADLAKRQEARRNVHQHFSPAQLLTVDGVAISHGAGTLGTKPAATALHSEAVKSGQQNSCNAPVASADAAPAFRHNPTGTGEGDVSMTPVEDDGRDIDAELEAVAAEAAELEEQLAAAESAEMAAAAEAGLIEEVKRTESHAAGSIKQDASANELTRLHRQGRKKRRSK